MQRWLNIDVITVWKRPWLQIAHLLAKTSQGMAALRSLKDMDRVVIFLGILEED